MINKQPLSPLLNHLTTKKIIIYGAGKIARLLTTWLEQNHIKIAHIWDKSPHLVDLFSAYNVTTINADRVKQKDDYVVLVTIYSPQIAEQMSNQFKRSGFQYVFCDREQFGDLFYQKCRQQKQKNTFMYDSQTCHFCPKSKSLSNRCDIYDDVVLNLNKKFTKNNPHQLIIPSLGLLVHNRCNLSCVGCNHLRDLYQDKDNKMLANKDILSDLQKITTIVRQINKVVLVGGEAFLKKDLSDLIQKIGKIDNIGLFQIITNGTIVPKDHRIFKTMADFNIFVEISGYGHHLTTSQKQNLHRFMALLDDYKVQYQYVKTLQWYDFGDFKHRGYRKDQWKEIYQKCCFVSNDLFDGQLHKCSRSAFAHRIHKVKDYKNDYVDVRHTNNPAILKQKLERFFKNDRPMICQHCNGTSTSTIAAGVQLKKQLRQNDSATICK